MARANSRTLPLALWLLSLCVATPLVNLAGGADALLSLSPLRCPLLLFTGIHCPTCGLGHALVHAWTFDLAHAWAHHPLGALCLPVTGALCLAWSLGPERVRHLGSVLDAQWLARPAPLLASVAAYIAWHVARLG